MPSLRLCFGALASALLTLLLAGCTGSVSSPETAIGQASVPPTPDVLLDSGETLLTHTLVSAQPDFPPAPSSLPPLRSASEGPTVVNGDEWVQEHGAGNRSGASLNGYVMLPGGEDDIAWAQYSLSVADGERPIEADFNVTGAPMLPGGEDDLPLYYYFGFANYTLGCWEWRGPYETDDPPVEVLNSETLRDRYLSPASIMYFVVLTDASQTPPSPPGNPQGLTAVELVSCTVLLDDGKITKPPTTQIDTLSALPGEATLTWTHLLVHDPADSYVVLRQEEGEAYLPIGEKDASGDSEYNDPEDNDGGANPPTSNKRYGYRLQAKNTAGTAAPSEPKSSNGWSCFPVDTEDNVGAGTSMSLLSGKPVISYHDSEGYDLKLAQSAIATPKSSTDWSTHVVHQGIGGQQRNYGINPTVNALNDMPYVVYFSAKFLSGDLLHFARATIEDPTTDEDWIRTDVSGCDISGSQHNTIIIDNRPAIAFQYYDSSLQYTRATTSTPSQQGDWWTVVVDDTLSADFVDLSTAVVGGMPTISYWGSEGEWKKLMFARATTPTPTSSEDWILHDVDTNGDVGAYNSLAVLNGLPALSYYDESNESLKFARSTTNTPSDAGDWEIHAVDDEGNVGQHCSLAVQDGKPIICYRDWTNRDLKFARATTETPSNADDWIISYVDRSGNVGEWASLIVLANGNPAISYYDAAAEDLKYAYWVGAE